MTGDTLKSSTSTLKKNKKAAVEEKFAETQEYLRKPNVLYPPWPSSPPTEHYHTLPSNLHHVHHPSPHHHNHHSHHHHQHHLSPRLYHGGPDSTAGKIIIAHLSTVLLKYVCSTSEMDDRVPRRNLLFLKPFFGLIPGTRSATNVLQCGCGDYFGYQKLQIHTQ